VCVFLKPLEINDLELIKVPKQKHQNQNIKTKTSKPKHQNQNIKTKTKKTKKSKKQNQN
jgi:hypothetical protein